MLSDFYNSFINLCEKNTNLYLIIKSKKNTVSRLNNNIICRLKNLEYDRRANLVFGLENETKSNFFYAQYSDISIGLGGYSTSISECVSGGLRGIYLDLLNLKHLDIYKTGQDRIIFNSLPDLISKIQKALKDNNLNELGKWQKREIQKIDMYHDDKGFIRIGGKIKELFSKF